MKFKPGSFYRHSAGRCIYITGTVETIKWGAMLVVEETDITGHGVSCIDSDTDDIHDQWTEIGKEEFMEVFNSVQMVSKRTASA